MAIRVRQMTMEEVEAGGRLARSRTEAARLVERAKIIWLSREGKGVKAIAQVECPSSRAGPSASFHLGASPTSPPSSAERYRLDPESHIDLPDEPLRR